MTDVRATVAFSVNGAAMEVPDDGASLLEVLRDRLNLKAAKDGCSPQGQCGCCTVWVDGQPRVACVTPINRVRGRSITTLEGLPDAARWSEALCATGGSQCGFCTPGIIMRLAAQPSDPKQALLAHLCRCTGWQTILEAAEQHRTTAPGAAERIAPESDRHRGFAAEPRPSAERPGASERAALEGRTPQRVAGDVALGRGGFADDTAPLDALIAVRAESGEWMVGETLTEARRLAGKVQGRRTTAPVTWPIDLPNDDWARTLQTTWVEPGYLEPDAAWSEPGGESSSALANGGAFGAKTTSDIGVVARRLADQYGRVVKALFSREDVVRFGPKRPPLGMGVRADGSGVVRVARAPGVAERLMQANPGLVVEEVDVVGPPCSVAIRGAGWVEAAVVLASLQPADTIVSPDGATASAVIRADGSMHITVAAGQVLDEVVLRSYCIGAAHQALGWVRSEAIAVDDQGEPHDLTLRSLGILRAIDMPHVEVTIIPEDRPAVNGSDAVFAAVAAAAWRHASWPTRWPTQR